MDKDFYEPIGLRISEVRCAHNMTQEALAKYLGVTPKHISHIECGTSGLSLMMLAKLCRLFDCSLDYIVFGESGDGVFACLPKEISDILYTGTDEERDRLSRYLQVYVELMQKQKR